jgi:hypothetical protein
VADILGKNRPRSCRYLPGIPAAWLTSVQLGLQPFGLGGCSHLVVELEGGSPFGFVVLLPAQFFPDEGLVGSRPCLGHQVEGPAEVEIRLAAAQIRSPPHLGPDDTRRGLEHNGPALSSGFHRRVGGKAGPSQVSPRRTRRRTSALPGSRVRTPRS